MDLTSVIKPTLILDRERCLRNIERVAQKASNQGVDLRPHFKTHQSLEVGSWFRSLGIRKITVSSIGMAEYFAQNQWEDITIAFPINILELDQIKSLSGRINLGLIVLDEATVDALGRHLTDPVFVWIKIDVGTHRTGLDPKNRNRIDAILDRVKQYEHISFKGFLAHAGHSYQKGTRAEIQKVCKDSLSTMLALKTSYRSAFPNLEISLGDTPTASVVEDFGEVDELRPGNFVFYDLMQERIGACTPNEISVALACPVVATHPERKQWIIYGGGIHFSKDYLPAGGNQKCFGRMVNLEDDTWSVSNLMENPHIVSLSQEHGVIQCTNETFHFCRPGDLSLWLPVHSCMTAEAMGAYRTTDGKAIDHYRSHVHE